LASSRSVVSRDDRGAYFVAMLGRLSSYQIRTHYVCYHIAKRLFDGTDLSIGMYDDRKKMPIYILMETYLSAMDFGKVRTSISFFLTRFWGWSRRKLIGELTLS